MIRIPLNADDAYLLLTPRGADLGFVWQIGLLALLLLVPMALVVWLYHYELQLIRKPHARGLLGLRLLLLLFLWIVVALQPTFAHVETEMVPSRVCVAVDLSQSMDVADVQRSADEAEELARALGASPAEVAGWSRKEIARRILSSAGIDLLRRLGRQHQVELIAFHETRWDVDSAALDALTSAGNGHHATDLRQALRPGGTAGSAPLHGILVLTDGRHNRGPSPLGLAQPLGIPIYPVALGSKRPPPDLLVLDVQAADKVFKGTTLPVTARVKAMHLPAQQLTVELQVAGKAVRPEDRYNIKHPGGDAVYEVKFQVPMDQAGTHALKVQAIASQGGEITMENNQRSHVVRVAEDKARVLLVDEEARWEYHYLAGALQRDPTVRLDRVLFAPPHLGLIKPDDLERAGLPRLHLPEPGVVDPLMDFDCIVLGDVAPERLPPIDRERLHRYVAERGGTLILVAGKRSLPLGYTTQPGAATDPLVKMLPIRDARVFESKDGFTLQLTEAGKRAPFLRLDPDAGAAASWPELPPHFWGVVGTRQPGATVLATPTPNTGGGRIREGEAPAEPGAQARQEPRPPEFGPHPNTPDAEKGILVQQSYGFGKVVFVGLDSTWRWRYRAGDVYHHRFWGQLVRWAAAERLLPAGNHLLRYGTREAVYQAGQPIELAVRLSEETAVLRHPEQARAKILRRQANETEEVAATVPLQANPQQARLLVGKLRELPAGTYRVELDIDELAAPANAKTSAAVFTVLPEENGELLDLSTNWELLEALAAQSGGQLFTPTDVAQVLELLAQKVHPRETRQDSRPWQDAPLVWWTLGLLIGLLTVEWLWRKGLELP